MRFPSVLVVALSIASTAWGESPAPTLTVTGEGRVAAVPDMATITLGVASQARTAGAAMGETSARVASILSALTASGIDGRDLQTQELSLHPVWNSRVNGTGEPEVAGFNAANTVTVRVRQTDRLGAVLDRVIDLGANTFQGLSFGLQAPEPALDEARREAVAEAMRKAALYADAAGLTLGPVLSISESGGQVVRPMMFEAARLAADVPVAGGEVDLSASVTMVFALGE